jgi:DNA-binding MarR family transcriptional regulator
MSVLPARDGRSDAADLAQTSSGVDEGPLSPSVEAAGVHLQNPRQLSDRIAIGRALWRDLVIGFAAQLGELRLGFTQLAALYAIASSASMTIADLAEAIGRSASATSRVVSSLEARGLLRRLEEVADRRQRLVRLTPDGSALLALIDRARADQFLAVVRPLPPAERALVAMGVAALANRAVTRRGRLIKAPPARLGRCSTRLGVAGDVALMDDAGWLNST